MDPCRSRRAVIRASVTAAGLGLAGSLAGCSQLDSLGSSADESPDDDTATDTTTSSYQQWLPAPMALDAEHYYFEAVDYEGLQANEPHFADSVYSDYAETDLFRELDIPVDSVESAIFLEPIADRRSPAVVQGEFTEQDVTETLAEFGYEEQSPAGDYAVYVGGSAIGVTDGRLVFTDDSERADIDAILNAKAGDGTRYGGASEVMATLLARLGTATFVYGATSNPTPPDDADPANGLLAGNIGFGYQDDVDGETTTTEIVLLFESADAVDWMPSPRTRAVTSLPTTTPSRPNRMAVWSPSPAQSRPARSTMSERATIDPAASPPDALSYTAASSWP
jgi:hypothetical protein